MALTTAQKAENRKDMAAGKAPRHQATALTAPAGQTVDATYGAEEALELTGHTIRQAEIEDVLQDFGFLT